MTHASRRLANVLPALVVGLAAAGCGAPAGTLVLKAGHEPWFLARAAAARDRAAASCPDLRVQGIRIDRDLARIALAHDAATAEVRMGPPSERCPTCLAARDFLVDFDPGDACAGAFATALHQDLQATDVPDVWTRVGRPPFATGSGVWLFLAGWGVLAAFVVLLARGRARPELLLIALLALGVRLALATWGPGDLQVNLHADKANVYGPAPYAVAWALERLLRPDDLVPLLVVVSALLGTAGVVVAHLFLREAGASRAGATVAALLLALHPLAIRVSGDCERQGYVLATQAVAFLAVAAAQVRGRWWPLAAFLLAGTLATLSRPEGAAVWAGAAIVALALPWSAKTLVVLAASVLGVGLGLLRYAGDFLVQARSVSSTLDFLPPVILDPGYTPVVATLLFPLGGGLALRRRDRMTAGLALLALLASLPALFQPTWGLLHASARYQVQALMPFAAVAASGLVALAGRLGARNGRAAPAWVLPVACVLVVAASVPAVVRVTRPVTIDREFAFLRRVLPHLPRGAVVYHAHPDGRVGDVAGFRGMSALSDWLGRDDIAWRLWDGNVPATPSPAFFYRQPACLLPVDSGEDPTPGNPGHECLRCVVDRCREGMARAAHDAMDEITIPAVRFGPERYTQARATIGLYPLLPPVP